ncbi:DUF7832 domain-containing protein [Anaerosporobacter sp.]|uniref:DUF7832 domain-containing protein n=1 Tax=Anaerosporobacter sp. TaxID=1872529 RepID=UPI00286F0702|nr:hypothetical protein [Anaerosporobacter sp.]
MLWGLTKGRKKVKEKAEIKKQEHNNENERNKKFEYDKSEWYWDSASERFCEEQNKTQEELTDEDNARIWEYAGNHIAFFVTWLIENDFYFGDGEDFFKEDLKLVKERKMTGKEFLTDNCDEVLSRGDICEEVLEFVDRYYIDKYMADYSDFVEEKIKKSVYGIAFSWEDYDGVRKVIDDAYREHKKY